MLKKFAVGFAVALVVLLVAIATRPATFAVRRTISVAAPPEAAYALIADFHRWAEWSPWEKLDPAMSKTFTGAASGVGAAYAWAGKKDAGEGRMTIVGATPAREVDIRLEFLKPFAATNEAVFTLAPTAGGTEVTWTMSGKNDFFGKAFSLFMDMDKLVGGDFERGLAAMKTAAESSPGGVAAPR